MRRKVAIVLIAVFATASLAFANRNVWPIVDMESDRFFVTKVLDVSNLVFNKDVRETTFIFELAQGDSIKIDCDGCAALLNNGTPHGNLSMMLKYAGTEIPVKKQLLGKWIGLQNSGGKIGLSFGRDGIGERWLALKSLSVLSKSNVSTIIPAGIPIGLVAVNNLCLSKMDASMKLPQTTFFLQMRNEDSYKVRVTGMNGGPQAQILGYVFKKGEEFARVPLTFATAASLPASGKESSLFGFEFSEAPAAKGLDCYHIDIDRIPLNAVGESSTINK